MLDLLTQSRVFDQNEACLHKIDITVFCLDNYVFEGSWLCYFYSVAQYFSFGKSRVQ